MFIFESNSLETTLLVFVVLILLVLWLNVSTVTNLFESSWNRFMSVIPCDSHALLIGASAVLIMMFAVESLSLTLLVIGIITLSLHWLNVPIVINLFESGWNCFKFAVPGETRAKIVAASVLMIMVFFGLFPAVLVIVVVVLLVYLLSPTVMGDLFKSVWKRFMSLVPEQHHAQLLGASILTFMMLVFGSVPSALLVLGVLVFSSHILNIPIVIDLFESGWNRFQSVIPIENHANVIGASILMIMMFLLGLFSFTHLVIVNITFYLHWLKVPLVTDLFESGWTHFKSVIPGESHANLKGASVLMTMMFFLGSFSLTLLVIGVVILSIHVFSLTTLTGSSESGWNSFKSVVPGEHFKVLEETTLKIKMLISESRLSVTLLLIIVLVLSVLWINFTFVTDLLTSGWSFSETVIPGLYLVESFGASVLTITTFIFGSYSATISVIGALIVSLHLVKFTLGRESLKPGWNRFKSVFQGEPLVDILEQTTLKIKVFIFESRLLEAFLIIVVLVFLLRWMNFTIVTDLFISGWSFSKSLVPGLYLVETFGASVLTITTFVFGANSSTVLVFGVLMLTVHLVKLTIVPHLYEYVWKHFRSVIQRENPAKALGASIVTIAIVVFGSVSSASLVLGVLIFSLHLKNITTVRGKVHSVWNHFNSVIGVYILEMIDGRGRLANVVRENSSQLTPQAGSLPVYQIPLKEKRTDTKGYKYYSFGKKSRKPNRTVVVLGDAGAGKSTVISGMMNHILGIKWKDSYRFKMVEDGQITVYKIYHQTGSKIDHSLTVVDTPGFGVSGNKEVSEQLRQLFYSLHDIGEVDAVCFVAQAALTRLTPTQKSTFDSILSMFGKDMAENIRILVTFADDQLPPVLEAIRVSGVSCLRSEDGLPVYFKFNNSCLFADNTSENSEQKLWNMGTSSMQRFFAALVCMKTFRVTLTSEVLGNRWQVESSVENLQMQVKLALAKLEKIKMTIGKVQQHKEEISKNVDFEFYITVKKPVKINICHNRQHITNCQQCQVTCHFPCSIPNDDGKRRCAAMGPHGYCTVCPGKCFWNVHFNQTFKWQYQEFKEKQTVKELQENFVDSTEEKLSDQGLVDQLMAEYEEEQEELMKLIQTSAQCLNRLKEMVQQPNALSPLDYIDLLTEGEKREAKPGWEQRVDSLTEIKQKAESAAKKVEK